MAKQTRKFKREFLEGLNSLIHQVLAAKPEDDFERMHGAILAAVSLKISTRLLKPMPEYGIWFLPVEAIALKILYDCYVTDTTSYLGNILHQISQETDKRFSQLM